MGRFFKIAGLSMLLGVSLTALSGLFFKRGIDYSDRGAPLCWIETQGTGFFGLDSYVVQWRHLVVDLSAWTCISSVLLTAFLSSSRRT